MEDGREKEIRNLETLFLLPMTPDQARSMAELIVNGNADLLALKEETLRLSMKSTAMAEKSATVLLDQLETAWGKLTEANNVIQAARKARSVKPIDAYLSPSRPRGAPRLRDAQATIDHFQPYIDAAGSIAGGIRARLKEIGYEPRAGRTGDRKTIEGMAEYYRSCLRSVRQK